MVYGMVQVLMWLMCMVGTWLVQIDVHVHGWYMVDDTGLVHG
jgi:hypothetical protein